MKEDFSVGILTGIIMGVIMGCGIGACAEQRTWERKIREGKGPALIEAVELEDKVRELRR